MKRSSGKRQTHRSLIETITDVFYGQKRVSVCKHMVNTVLRESFAKLSPEWVRGRKGRSGGDGGKFDG